MNDKSNYINSIHSIFKTNQPLEIACRQLIFYLSDNKFDNQLENDTDPLAQLYDLSIKYLDNDYSSDKDKLALDIQNTLAKLR